MAKLSLIKEGSTDATVPLQVAMKTLKAQPDQGSGVWNQGSGDATVQLSPQEDDTTLEDDLGLITPDSLLKKTPEPHSIIYLEGEAYVDTVPKRTHIGFLLEGEDTTADELRAHYLKLTGRDVIWLQNWRPKDPRLNQWFATYNKYLFGRVAMVDKQQVVAFWGLGSNFESKTPLQQIPECLEVLLRNKVIRPNAIVVPGDGSHLPIEEYLQGKVVEQPADPAQLARQRLAMQAHMATGDTKDILRKYAGGSSSRPQQKRSPWDVALQRHNLRSPGNAHWRGTSESLQRRLDRIFRSPPGG